MDPENETNEFAICVCVSQDSHCRKPDQPLFLLEKHLSQAGKAVFAATECETSKGMHSVFIQSNQILLSDSAIDS